MTEKDSPINVITHPVSGECENAGLSKREYMAMKAMQAILSNSKMTENAKDAAISKGIPITEDAKELIEPFAKLAVDCADALIEALNK